MKPHSTTVHIHLLARSYKESKTTRVNLRQHIIVITHVRLAQNESLPNAWIIHSYSRASWNWSLCSSWNGLTASLHVTRHLMSFSQSLTTVATSWWERSPSQCIPHHWLHHIIKQLYLNNKTKDDLSYAHPACHRLKDYFSNILAQFGFLIICSALISSLCFLVFDF